jgi:N-glycosidase YbiA
MITDFHKEGFQFLSNFFPCQIKIGKLIFDTSEHAYQAEKTLVDFEKDKIRQCKTPGQSKRLGQKITIRQDWEVVKLDCMEKVLRVKFSHPEMKKLLLETGTQELIEGNKWSDKFWGMTLEDEKWIGENHLGKILMKIRSELTLTG